MKVQIVVIVAVHNRLEKTRALIEGISRQSIYSSETVSVIVVDDGSSDGTTEFLKASSFVTKLIEGDGSWYWAKSMSRAEVEARKLIRRNGDLKNSFILWLNDDVWLFPKAFEDAIHVSMFHQGSIVVGFTKSHDSNEVTYGPLVRKGFHPLSFNLPSNGVEIETAETFNGNFVLVPYSVAETIDGLDERFSHGMSDIDYGLRAKKLGVPIQTIPKPIGLCNRNPKNQSRNTIAAWKEFTSVKGAGNLFSMSLLLSRITKLWLFWVFTSYILWWSRQIKVILRSGKPQ